MRLVDQGFPYKTILNGRRIAGRVVKHASEPCYVGIIGRLTVKAPSEREAFEEVVAQHLGFASAAELFIHNARVRAKNRAQKRHARYVVGEMLRGNFAPLDDVLGVGPVKGDRQ
jgi:hypothetical protein